MVREATKTMSRLSALLALLWLPVGQAHQVWLEPHAGTGQLALYFGEYGDNLREVSPGLLDKFVKPTAYKTAGQGERVVALVKSADGYRLTGVTRNDAVIAEEATYPISERKEGDKTVRSLYHPAARWSAVGAKAAPRLSLDLVPTGKVDTKGVELQAHFHGPPLAKAKVLLVTAAGWTREYRSGDDGKFTVTLPWRGTYVLELGHRVSAAGERTGVDGQAETFDRASYVTSLTLTQPKGLPALPALPAATPHKMN